MELLVERATPIRRSSDSRTRVPVREHASSLHVRVTPGLLPARIVLLDDMLVKGAQALACFIELRRAGYTGPIEAYAVHQAIAPNPTKNQREPFQCHHIAWSDARPLPHRTDIGVWRASNREQVIAAPVRSNPLRSGLKSRMKHW